MGVVGQIAKNTFREAVRDKTLYALAFFAAVMLVASLALGWVSASDQWQIVQDFGLLVASVFGALTAAFLGGRLIHQEIDRRTLYTVLARPIHRWQVVLGKYFGLAGVLGVLALGMGLAAAAASVWAAYNTPGDIAWTARIDGPVFAKAVGLIYMETLAVTSLAVLFGTMAGPFLSSLFTFSIYLIGQKTSTMLWMVQNFRPSRESVASVSGEHLTDVVSSTYWLIKPLTWFLYYTLPDLAHFQLRNRVVLGPPPEPGSAARLWLDGEVGLAILYGGGYVAVILLLACFVFSRRRL